MPTLTKKSKKSKKEKVTVVTYTFTAIKEQPDWINDIKFNTKVPLHLRKVFIECARFCRKNNITMQAVNGVLFIGKIPLLKITGDGAFVLKTDHRTVQEPIK